MTNRDSAGSINVLLIPLILTVLLLIGATSFAVWAFMGRQDYKNNVTPKITAAVAAAVAQNSSQKDKEFQEKAKLPLTTYNGPSSYGSIFLQYPKTWSGYVDASANNTSTPVDGYFYPGVVPSITDQASAFALRVQVVAMAYSDVLQSYQGQQQSGQVQIAAYALPKLSKVVGVEITGTIASQKTGTLVVLPMRDKTLKIWTEGNDFLNDFNNNILANFSFSP